MQRSWATAANRNYPAVPPFCQRARAMFRILLPVSLIACLVLAAVPAPVFAENEGQADLDKATQLKVTAESLDDLNEVIDRTDSALEKGLDAENKKFADQLLVSSLVQRGQLFSAAVF